MVSSPIALRFRDTTPGVDTIQSHLDILNVSGRVWWGWWKKEFEDDQSEFLRNADQHLEVLLVDRSTERMFRGTSVDRLTGAETLPDLSLVPGYYQDSANSVYGWFLLTSLEEIDYQEEIGSKFADGTFLVYDTVSAVPASQSKEASRQASARSSILHLSDLHFGQDYDFLVQNELPKPGNPKQTLTECVVTDLERLGLSDDIEAIIVSGDFTSNGDWSDEQMEVIVAELTALRKALGVDVSNLIALPGNHDVERYPEGQKVDIAKLSVDSQTTYKHERDFRFFLSNLSGRDVQQPLSYSQKIPLLNADVFVGVLNSCRILATEWTEYGFVGKNGLEILNNLAAEPVARPTYKIMAMHHHLLPVTDVESPNKKGVTLSLDASVILETAQNAGFQIALHGHQHMPRLARYQSLPLMGNDEKAPLTVISNGSAGVSDKRRPGSERNTYCVLTFRSDDVELRMREIRSDGKQGGELFGSGLSVAPTMPS